MNILVTGANGQLGTELGIILEKSKLADNLFLASHDDLDITNFTAVRDFTIKHHIDTIINCAAYTAVDDAEDNYIKAKQINCIGPQNLASTGCKIIHPSTDYVFSGQKKQPYKPTDETNPSTIYGYTKLMGEQAVTKNAKEYVIIRTSWVFSPYGKNFVKTMRKLGATKKNIDIVSDQIGTPTYAKDLASAIVEIIPQMNPNNRGIYHFSNMGQCSWYDFACEIMKLSELKCKVYPIPTHAYPTKALRPKYSVLDTTKIRDIFGIEPAPWQDALQRCIHKIKEIERQ
jgi:dTDP-4-dehydrorhamnose reductase